MSINSGSRGLPCLVAAFWLCCLLGPATLARAADPGITFVTLGTSPSLYYQIGRALCAVVDKTRREHGIRCSPEPTPGSVYNLERIEGRDLDFGLAQSDAHFAAYRGEGGWTGRPFTALRSVMSLQPELLTVMARADAGVSSLADLRGKRINIGNPGSGTRATWDQLQSALGWGADDLRQARELGPDPAGAALCSGEIDASVLMVGHPSPIVAKDVDRCALWFLAVQGPEVDRMVEDLDYYAPGVIAKGMYGLAADVWTFGGRATLVTSSAMPDAVVYRLVKAILDDLDSLRALHPALANLNPEEMATATLTAPLHPGAERAFREFGALK